MKIIILSITLLFFSFNLFSQTEKKEEKSKEETRTSKQNREKKSWRFLIGSGGQFSEFGAHLAFAKHLDRDQMIELEIFLAEDNEAEKNSFRGDYETVAISLNYQNFLGNNSFFIKPGFFYGNHKAVGPAVFLTPQISDLHRSDIGLKFSIGNQWQWKNFTLSCEWFGYQRGIVRLKKEGRDRSLFADGKDGKNWNSFTALKLGLGATF